MPIQDYEIATGWDNTAGYTNIESISPAGATAYKVRGESLHYFVQSLGNLNIPYQYTPANIAQNGFAKTNWYMSFVSVIALKYMRDTYGQDSAQGGKVTISTTFDSVTFEDKNAFLFVRYPQTPSIEYNGASFFQLESPGIALEFRIVGDAT